MRIFSIYNNFIEHILKKKPVIICGDRNNWNYEDVAENLYTINALKFFYNYFNFSFIS